MANENKSPVNANGTIIGRLGESLTIGASDASPTGLHGVTPIARAQVTTISANLTGALTGITDGVIANVSNISLVGNTAAEIQSVVNTAIADTNLQLKELQTKLNEVITKTNDLITALQNKGIIKA